MGTYPKLFVYSALGYLAVATGFGLAIVLDPEHAATHRFLHIHFLFLGFMLFLVAGLAYELLPRLKTGSMCWPRLIPIHFWLGNLALCGKAVSYLFRTEVGMVPFVVCACCVIGTLFLFGINVVRTLQMAEQRKDASLNDFAERSKRAEPAREVGASEHQSDNHLHSIGA